MEISINTDSIVSSFDLSSIIEDFSVFPLREQSGHYIGEVSKILKRDENIIVFDRLKTKRVLVFDNEGNFLTKPADVGRSDDDPMQLNDCWINVNGELEVYDFSAKKIYKYNQNFKLQSILQSKYDRVFTALIDDGHDRYIGYKGYTPYNSYREQKSYKVALLQNDLAINERFMHYHPDLNDALLPNTNSPLLRIDDHVIILEQFSNSIMAINNGELYEKYKIAYSKAQLLEIEKTILLPNQALLKSKQPDFNQIYSLFKGYYVFNGEWQETSDFIIIQSSDPTQKVFYSIYDKRKQKVLVNAYNLTFDNGKSFLPPFMATSYKTNEFLAVYPGYMLKTIISKESKLAEYINGDLEANYAVNVKLK